MYIKEIIPPILLKIFQKLFYRQSPTNNLEKSKTQKQETIPTKFSCYEDALHFCDDGYEDRQLVEVVLKKTKKFIEKIKTENLAIKPSEVLSLVAMINPIIENKNNSLNVLDFGGACGAHYFRARNLLPQTIKLNWVVVETPTMVQYAKALQSAELKFFDNLADAVNKLGKVDFLHTSGTIQYVSNPFNMLNELLDLKPYWIFFGRLGLNKLNRNVITIQQSLLSWNGPGELPEGYEDRTVKYPFTFIPESQFIDKVQENYKIFAKFADESGMYEVKEEEIVGYSLLCKLKTI